jgi:hypothetical protein
MRARSHLPNRETGAMVTRRLSARPALTAPSFATNIPGWRGEKCKPTHLRPPKWPQPREEGARLGPPADQWWGGKSAEGSLVQFWGVADHLFALGCSSAGVWDSICLPVREQRAPVASARRLATSYRRIPSASHRSRNEPSTHADGIHRVGMALWTSKGVAMDRRPALVRGDGHRPGTALRAFHEKLVGCEGARLHRE